jgi:hypothetical protein
MFVAALLQAAGQYDLNDKREFHAKKIAWKILPYILSLLPAIYNEDLAYGLNVSEVAPWIAFYIALTWVLIYSIRKQWQQ